MITQSVRGEFAMFRYPDLRMEGVSQDALTATAAQAILACRYGKPQFHWIINKIEIINPIKKVSTKFNELSNLKSVNGLRRSSEKSKVYKNRIQRNYIMLKDVEYRIYAEVHPISKFCSKDVDEGVDIRTKAEEIFNRRKSVGGEFKKPFLGASNFYAYFTENNKTPNVDVCTVLTSYPLARRINSDGRMEWLFRDIEVKKGVIDLSPYKNLIISFLDNGYIAYNEKELT